MRLLAVLAFALLLAGCIQVKAPSLESTPAPDDGVTTLSLTVADAATGNPLPGAHVSLLIPGKGVVRKDVDHAGAVRFTVQPAASCSLTVERSGYQGGAVALDCRRDQAFRIPLKALAGAGAPRPSVLPGQTTAPPPGSVLLQGSIVDALDGSPVPGVLVRLDAPNGPTQRTSADGQYSFAVMPGHHTLTTDAPCWATSEFPVELKADTVLDIRLAGDAAPPGAPTGLRATGGPGPGMVAVAWAATPGAAGYELMRGDPPKPLVRLDNSLAYGIHGAAASDKFWVAARNSCGFTGAVAGPVSATPLPGTPATPLGTVTSSPSVTIGQSSYPVRNATGLVVRQAQWRTIDGTGNCCENHVVTSSDGNLVDIGAETVYLSKDAGASWSRIAPPAPPLCGEGAGSAAPDGDLVMFDWIACIPIMDDQVVTLKYSKATDQWFSQVFPVHSPFYDRPWMGVVKGPFMVQGMIVPYLTFAIGGYPSKEVMLVSLDGLHFVQPSSSSLDALSNGVSLPALDLQPDAGRDWIQATTNAGLTPLDHGLGLRWQLNLLGGPQLLQDSTSWGDAQLGQATIPPGAAIQADGAGTLHALSAQGSAFTYSWSHDGGRTWNSLSHGVDGTVGVWDFRASSAFDEAVFAVQVLKWRREGPVPGVPVHGPGRRASAWRGPGRRARGRHVPRQCRRWRRPFRLHDVGFPPGRKDGPLLRGQQARDAGHRRRVVGAHRIAADFLLLLSPPRGKRVYTPPSSARLASLETDDDHRL